MSIFDQAVSRTDAGNPITSEFEGFLGLLYAGITSDGKQKSSEINLALDIMIHKKMFTGADTHNWIPKAKSVYDAVGNEEKFINYAADKISPPLRPMVFATIVDMMLSDGEVVEAEKRTLEHMQSALKIDDALALKIIEVIVIKNKGNG
jgi:uncharacterized tellurite resistance protein B-like protein